MGSTPYIFEFLFQVLIGFISYKISCLHFLDRFGLTLTYFVFKNNHSLINCSEEQNDFCIDDSFYDSFSIFTLQVNDEVYLELVDTLLKGFFDGSEQIVNLLSNLLNIFIYAEKLNKNQQKHLSINHYKMEWYTVLYMDRILNNLN
jgi:hypothetical protein